MNRAGLTGLIVGEQRHDGALGASATGATGTVDVVLVVGREVIVHDARDVINVNPAGRHIRGDEYLRAPAGERTECPVSLPLGTPAVNGDRGESFPLELFGQSISTVLGAREHHCGTVFMGQLGCDSGALLAPHITKCVAGAIRVRGLRCGLAMHGIVLIPLDQFVDCAIQSG